MTSQSAAASRAQRGGRPALCRPEPDASARVSLAANDERTGGAAHPPLADSPRGHTAHEASAAKPARRGRAKRLHFFLSGGRSLCGISGQRTISGVDVDCGSCRRIAKRILERWLAQ